MFLGLVDMPKADASTIVQVIKSAVAACGLNLVNCRGQGYNGAAVMSGITSGVLARFKQDFPSMLYIHCLGHQLNLVVQDCFKSCTKGSNSSKILHSSHFIITFTCTFSSVNLIHTTAIHFYGLRITL